MVCELLYPSTHPKENDIQNQSEEGEQDTLDHIYNITAKDADYVEPDADGVIDWQCDSSYMSDSDDGLENWQN